MDVTLLLEGWSTLDTINSFIHTGSAHMGVWEAISVVRYTTLSCCLVYSVETYYKPDNYIW